MDLWKLVSMLEHQALYFPVVALLGDELEAAPAELPNGSSEEDRWKQWRFWMLWRSTFFASCWHCAMDESAAMWNLYAGRSQGIAVRSSLQALSDAFTFQENPPPMHLIKGGLVDYVDPDSRTPMYSRATGDEHVLRKRSWYVSEKELRVLVELSANFIEPKDSFEEGHYKRGGIWVRCDLHKLIQCIVVAPKTPNFYESSVRAVVHRFDLDPELVRPSRLNQVFVPPNPLLVQEVWRRRH
jgi:hypothetical protein